jgi:hypothetical protein
MTNFGRSVSTEEGLKKNNCARKWTLSSQGRYLPTPPPKKTKTLKIGKISLEVIFINENGSYISKGWRNFPTTTQGSKLQNQQISFI